MPLYSSVQARFQHFVIGPVSGDGSSVGNGGGDRESLISIVYPEVQNDLKRCQSLGLCGDIPKSFFTCRVPTSKDLSFQNISDNPGLAKNVAYLRVKTPESKLILSRDYLYNKKNHSSFNRNDATKFIARVLLELCGIAKLSETKSILKDIGQFYALAWESITVGIDDLELYEEELIFVKSYHQYLILESRVETAVLVCSKENGLTCSRLEKAKENFAPSGSFSYLSLFSEAEMDKNILFQVQAYYENTLFNLNVITEKGEFTEIKINGKAL